MSGQQRIPFWQVWRLRLRALYLGWGQNVLSLRQFGRRQAWASLSMLALPAMAAVFVYAPPPLGEDRPPHTLTATLHLWLPPMALILALMAISAAWSASYLRRASAGEHQLPTTLEGECFATASDIPRRLFALIGPTRERAQWFCLPPAWEAWIEPSPDRYTLTYTPATGFVERLERSGASSFGLTQRADVSIHRDTSGATISQGPTGAATREQRRTLLREARIHGWAWMMSDGALSALGWLLVASGCGYASFLAISAPLLVSPERLTPENAQVLPFLVPIFGIMSIATFVAGGVLLRVWARRRGAAAAPISIEGEQVCWTPTGLRSSTIGATLAQVRLDNDEQRVFLVPARLSHRVRRLNTHVRVMYNEQTGPVLDYRAVDLSADHPTA